MGEIGKKGKRNEQNKNSTVSSISPTRKSGSLDAGMSRLLFANALAISCKKIECDDNISLISKGMNVATVKCDKRMRIVKGKFPADYVTISDNIRGANCLERTLS